MAESAVKSSIDVLGKILVEEGKHLWRVDKKLEELQDKLLWMRSFLRKAEAFKDKDEIVWTWVCQVQKYAYEAEDIIDKFAIQVLSRRQQNGLLNKLKRYSYIFRELYHCHQAASSINSLTVKVSTLSPKLEKYGLMRSLGVNTDHVEEARAEQIHYILENAHLEDKKIVGLEYYANELIHNLTSQTPADRRFHAIYGMGGLGKTTLAAEVFKDGVIQQHFTGGQAFVYISKRFHVRSVIEAVHKNLKVPRPENENESLELQLQKYLKENKCLVVLDDVWTKEAWDSLKSVFALCDKYSGTKVLLTTRKEDVAKHVDSGALQSPRPLDYALACDLLEKTMGWDLQDPPTSPNQIQDPQHASDVSEKRYLARKMLKMCNGVPLFIVVLGGILRKKQSLAEWKSVFGNITSHLRTGYDHGRSCTEILLQSYDDLPYHLKPCFLHLASFPENYQISTENLYRMWAAEGLVTRSTHDRTISTKCLEDVASDYLNDLVQVGLVEIVDVTSEGWIDSIQMHDLVRDVCYEKAVTNNVLKTIDLRSGQHQQLNTSDYCSEKRLIRMAIYLSDESIKSFIEDFRSSKAPKYLRSLLLFPSGEGPTSAECQQLMTHICSEFQLLCVLVVEDIRLSKRLTSHIKNLIHLRYLSLANTEVSELPSCIGKLRFLEILDLRVCGQKLIVPNTLWKLFRLRHLLFPDEGYEMKWLERLRIDTLICLEVIENLEIKNLQTKGLRKMKILRHLSIVEGSPLSREEAMDIIVALKSNHFQRFFLDIEGSAISKEPMLLSSISFNLELEISGKIQDGVIHTIELPRYLEWLTLSDCHIKDDPMGILGCLDLLKSLTFNKGSYAGKKLSCPSDSFPLLEHLIFSGLEVLEEWELGSGSMPNLNSLKIERCDKLERAPYVLPSSLQALNVSRDIYGYMYHHAIWLRDQLLDGESTNIVLLGKGSEDMVVDASVLGLYFKGDVARHFDAIARTRVPRRTSCRAGDGFLPRSSLQKLLRDLRDPKQSREGQDLSRMSSHDLLTELQQTMQEKRCLVIVVNLEVDVEHVQADLENTFGNPRGYGQRGSKLLVIFESDTETSLPARECQTQRLTTPTQIQMWRSINAYENVSTNAGIKWNIMASCLRQGLSIMMCRELIHRGEKFTTRATEHEKLIDSSTIEPSPNFTSYYNDLEPHVRHCLIYLAKFPAEFEISTKTLHQMWIAADIFGSQPDDDWMVKFMDYLICNGMVTALKMGPPKWAKRCQLERPKWAKTCQLKPGLRDLCLAKAKEEHRPKSPLNPASFAVVQLDQNLGSSASLIEKPSILEVYSSATSLLFFSYVNDPLYNEESWEWLLYICKHFYFLRVLDLKGMWLTKGSLPEDIGELRQLRYLSLRGTRVTQLPWSIEDLTFLQTLDLRVLESIIIPNVLWKLNCLAHLYLPDFIAQETVRLQLSGLCCLETLVNLQTDKVFLTDMLELQRLKKITIRNIHTLDVVDELDGILKQRSQPHGKTSNICTSLEVCINTEIINANPTILRGFQNLHKLKMKGMISGDLHHKMFPTNVKEVTLKHTKLEEDPLSVLEKLPQLRSLILGHESYLGKEMTFSREFYERTELVLCSLNNLETLHSPEHEQTYPSKIDIHGCWRVEKKELPTNEEEHACTQPRTFDLSSWKKGFKSLTCC